MGIFSSILDKLRHHGRTETRPNPIPQQTSSSSAQNQTAQVNAQTTELQSKASTAQAAALQNVDIDAVLSNLASKKGGGGNYRQSIVDLLKLLDLDSSLVARTELAGELNVHAGPHGSAEQNIALYKAVVRKLEENGGKVPDSMRT